MSVILQFIDRPIQLTLTHVGLPGPAGTGGGGNNSGGITSIDITTPTTLTGLIKGVSSHLAAATAGVDYAAASHTQAASTISDSTAPGRALLTAATAAAQRTALGLGNAAVANIGTLAGNVADGAHTHAHSALTSLQGGTTGEYYHMTSAQNTSLGTVTAAGWDLIDDAAATNQRTTLGLGNAAVANIGTLAGNVAAGDDSRFSYVRNNAIWIDAGCMRPKTGAAGPSADGYDPNTTSNVSCDILNFDSNGGEKAYFKFQMDEAWDLGTMKAKFVWTLASSPGSNVNVNWQIAAGAVGNNANLSNIVLTNYANVIHACSTANFVGVTPATGPLTVSGTPALGSPLYIVVSTSNSTGGGNAAQDIGLHGVWLQYKTLSTLPSAW